MGTRIAIYTAVRIQHDDTETASLHGGQAKGQQDGDTPKYSKPDIVIYSVLYIFYFKDLCYIIIVMKSAAARRTQKTVRRRINYDLGLSGMWI